MEYSEGKLRIFTLPEFENFELKEKEYQISLLLNFICVEGTRSVRFIQEIEAVNNFEPEFSASEYEIIIPTPLPTGLDISMFLLVSSSIPLESKVKQFKTFRILQ